MANLKEVKNRIVSVTSTMQITSAMKMVAAAKLRRAQDRIIQMRPYSQKMTGILQNVSAGLDGSIENVFGEIREESRVLLVVVTSDRGLCGGFNSNVFKTTEALIEEKYSYQKKSGDLYILPIGKRSFEYFKKRKFQLVDDYYEMFGNLSFDEAKIAANAVMNGFVNGDWDKVELVYNEFKNVATQILRAEQFLPVEAGTSDELESSTDYLYEPTAENVVQEMIPKSLRIQFYKAVLESNASEHGARMTAMDQATDNAEDLIKELKLTYNRSRQAAITKEILEIVGGAEALSDG
jgi:F-type H+-transporting ATPase subunit gamma